MDCLRILGNRVIKMPMERKQRLFGDGETLNNIPADVLN